MVLKYFENRGILGRLIFDLALVFIAISTAFNFFAWEQLTHIAKSNNHNGIIIKAATGCADVDTAAQCKSRLADANTRQLVGFASQEDCWTRRALAGLPAPRDYAVKCTLP